MLARIADVSYGGSVTMPGRTHELIKAELARAMEDGADPQTTQTRLADLVASLDPEGRAELLKLVDSASMLIDS
jgi:hypothetical protein